MLFFLLIQETVLSLLVGFYFTDSIGVVEIVIISVYGLMMLVYLGICTHVKMAAFANPFTQFINVFKKIILPILLVAPQPYQYSLIMLMIVTVLFEMLYEKLDSLYPLRSRIFVYKLL